MDKKGTEADEEEGVMALGIVLGAYKSGYQGHDKLCADDGG